MCDYSLMSLSKRLARQGEELIVHRFPCGAKGLVSPIDLLIKRDPPSMRLRKFWEDLLGNSVQTSYSASAVCIPPGSRLLVRDIQEELRQEIGLQRTEEVTFTQITASPFMYRDALRFWNGREVLLQRLSEGQHIRVLDVSLTDFMSSHAEATLGMDDGDFAFPLPSIAMDTGPAIDKDFMFPGVPGYVFTTPSQI